MEAPVQLEERVGGVSDPCGASGNLLLDQVLGSMLDPFSEDGNEVAAGAALDNPLGGGSRASRQSLSAGAGKAIQTAWRPPTGGPVSSSGAGCSCRNGPRTLRRTGPANRGQKSACVAMRYDQGT